MNHEASINEGIFSIARFDDVMSKQKNQLECTQHTFSWMLIRMRILFLQIQFIVTTWKLDETCVTCDVFSGHGGRICP
jgi:hypothetical protein